ncbi:2-polyprenyl-6-methoxyphenol hydroxylase-like FAD-dependent oxidoreductase [Saccharothrix tamanrassetensis]|uniref:2-polyprenyl-6-methoxyphenol hydroxylase-like FAD-dependent oxidoreductase n=1 Tax=Saccharothrix tamanrassetensis TaxID=1051531 RepID=A0A841CDL3_9PSEU|nr:FAD-dependent monooxygenase [Saccharothrix tamanrassetensis]MBB5955351.1 2-polyprenyl-6-methoxyphenol hydroxylase-like FAD-dependent oxidoreductase [Saccharothrix tamanrassetensis]
MDILISGASVAGPAVALWLNRYGHRTTVVERSPVLRDGGFGVDFRGEAHLTVLRRMGILDEVHRHATGMGAQVVVDGEGRELARLPADAFSGAVEIRRGDLSRLMWERTRDRSEYIFGDTITSLTETRSGVDVTFRKSAPRTFDLVVGADGLHSVVRRLAFGPEERYLTYLGHHIAGVELAGNPFGLDRTGLIYTEPNRGVLVNPTSATFIFPAPAPLDRDDAHRVLAEVFGDAGWEVPRLLKQLTRAEDLYFDSISRVDVGRWSSGRIVLLGDAAYGATVGGLGTGAAMVGAYVLAGELATARDDYVVAFSAYESELRRYVEGGQKLAAGAGKFMAPPTEAKIRQRNRMYRVLNSRLLSGFFAKMTVRAANAIRPKDYAQILAA